MVYVPLVLAHLVCTDSEITIMDTKPHLRPIILIGVCVGYRVYTRTGLFNTLVFQRYYWLPEKG